MHTSNGGSGVSISQCLDHIIGAVRTKVLEVWYICIYCSSGHIILYMYRFNLQSEIVIVWFSDCVKYQSQRLTFDDQSPHNQTDQSKPWSEDDYRSGSRNISHQQQSFWRLLLPGWYNDWFRCVCSAVAKSFSKPSSDFNWLVCWSTGIVSGTVKPIALYAWTLFVVVLLFLLCL